MEAISSDAIETARSETMSLMLAQLKAVARAGHLPVSGSKAVLQNRIIDSSWSSIRIRCTCATSDA